MRKSGRQVSFPSHQEPTARRQLADLRSLRRDGKLQAKQGFARDWQRRAKEPQRRGCWEADQRSERTTAVYGEAFRWDLPWLSLCPCLQTTKGQGSHWGVVEMDLLRERLQPWHVDISYRRGFLASRRIEHRGQCHGEEEVVEVVSGCCRSWCTSIHGKPVQLPKRKENYLRRGQKEDCKDITSKCERERKDYQSVEGEGLARASKSFCQLPVASWQRVSGTSK